MKLRHLGYVGQNTTLGATTNHTFRLGNLTEEKLRAAVEHNLDDLDAILAWNLAHGVHFFRIGSSAVPYASLPELPLDWAGAFAERFAAIRRTAERHRLRLTMHPGQYVVLNSPRPEVVERSLAELEYHARFLELVCPHLGTMTLHVGGAYGDKAAATARFADGVARLSERARARLVLENDDTTYSAPEVLGLAETLGLPVTFDFFHHRLNPGPDVPGGLPELLERAAASWGGRVPKFHLSSAREPGRGAHADRLERGDLEEVLAALAPLRPGEWFDLMLEAKAKEVALLEVMGWVSEGRASARTGSARA